MSKQTNPVLVDIYRNNIVESFHRGSALVVDVDGQDYLQIGDVERHIYPRSALKFFQTIPLVASGAAKHFQLNNQQIALSCASHSGEQQHVTLLENWLSSQGLSQTDLENGPALPGNQQARHQCLAEGKKTSKLYHNCSGKHCGMLILSKFLKTDLVGYSQYDHPTQQLWIETLSELISLDIMNLPWERDGCGLPAIVMPLRSLAQAAVLYANTENISEPRRRSAMNLILHAVQSYPQLIAGSERCCSAVIAVTQGNIIVKTGAEGVYMGLVQDRRLGFALKIDDGDGLASEVTLGALLNKLGVLSPGENEKLQKFFSPDILNSQKYRTGYITPSNYWKENSLL